MKNNKTVIVAIAALAIIGIISGTYAYFTSTASVTNEFTALTYKTTIERNLKDGTWVPGTTLSAGEGKEYQNLDVKNNGTTPIAVRATVVETITRGEGESATSISTTLADDDIDTSATLTDGKKDVVVKRFGTDWEQAEDGKWYYTHVLNQDQATTNLIDSLTYNAGVANKVTCTPETDTTHEGNIVCSSSKFDGSSYNITITFDTIQATAVTASWTQAPEALNTAASAVKGYTAKTA